MLWASINPEGLLGLVFPATYAYSIAAAVNELPASITLKTSYAWLSIITWALPLRLFRAIYR